MAKKISKKTLKWARLTYKTQVQAFADDPSGCLCGDSIRKSIKEDIRLGKDLGLDFEKVIRKEATVFELERINRLIDEEKEKG